MLERSDCDISFVRKNGKLAPLNNMSTYSVNGLLNLANWKMDMNNLSTSPVSRSVSAQGILHIQLNRPQSRNALNAETLTALEEAFLTAQQDTKIRGILISGNGKLFSAGADIQALRPLNQHSGTQFSLRGQAVFQLLAQSSKPSVAAIQGGAYGGGLELALACTFRISSPESAFGFPEIKLGILPGFGGCIRATELLGKTRTRQLCLTGQAISAETALSWNLIQAIHPQESLLESGFALLQQITQFSQESIQHILYLSDLSQLSTSEKFTQEARCFGLACENPNKNLGVDAFLEKKTPRFI